MIKTVTKFLQFILILNNPLHNHTGVYSFVIWMKIPFDYDDQVDLPNSKGSNFEKFYILLLIVRGYPNDSGLDLKSLNGTF